MTKLTIACVNVQNYLGRGKEYVDKLYASVKKNLNQPFNFHCMNEGNLTGWYAGISAGWWAKVDLFEPGRFSGRVLYIDLDSVIVGPLDDLVNHKGIIDMKDWYRNDHEIIRVITPTGIIKDYFRNQIGFNSSVMVWDAGEHEEIFTKFNSDIPKQTDKFPGDQDWIDHLGGWNCLPTNMVVSYRHDCKQQIFPGSCICTFHGQPKPHEITTGWVPEYWKL